MNVRRIRASLMLLVFAALVSGTLALARPPLGTTTKCTKYQCPSPTPYVCQDPYTGSGYCTQGKFGPGFGTNIGCCCCSAADASNRWFHGE